MSQLHIRIKKSVDRLILLTVAVILAFAWLVPVLGQKASAVGQITDRKLVISSAVPSDTGVTYAFTFTPDAVSTVAVQGLKFIACTTAVGTYPTGTCTPPPGMTASGDGFDNAAYVSQSGWQGAVNFAIDNTGANDCLHTPNVICANRTSATSQTVTPRTITFNTIKNPSTPNSSFYVGIYTYGLSTYTVGSRVDFGATAAAVVVTLTTYAAVAEVLQFCVGSTTVDSDLAANPVATDCTGVSGSSVNLGTLDSSQLTVSPVTTNGGDSNNGVAMLRTNATNGATVSYRSIPATTGTNHLGALRISGRTCNTTGDPGADGNGNTKTDACINSAGATQGSFTAGSEAFGMTIAGVNCGGPSSYSCVYSTGNYNLVPQTNYVGKAGNVYCTVCNNITSADGGNGYAWVESGAATVIASSASSTIKQVDDEALILKFAATPEITTAFGPYSVSTDFIAIPTF